MCQKTRNNYHCTRCNSHRFVGRYRVTYRCRYWDSQDSKCRYGRMQRVEVTRREGLCEQCRYNPLSLDWWYVWKSVMRWECWLLEERRLWSDIHEGHCISIHPRRTICSPSSRQAPNCFPSKSGGWIYGVECQFYILGPGKIKGSEESEAQGEVREGCLVFDVERPWFCKSIQGVS